MRLQDEKMTRFAVLWMRIRNNPNILAESGKKISEMDLDLIIYFN
jgi:hypothetical protein